VARVRFDAFDAGVRFFTADAGMSSSAGSAPVMVSSASSWTSGVFSHGIFLLERVVLDFVTRPSLSSLKLLVALLSFLVCAGMGFAGCLAAGAAFGLVGFATRDATFERGGRGIVASGQCEYLGMLGVERRRMSVVAIGMKWAATVREQWG
jgi:hypothetical protein